LIAGYARKGILVFTSQKKLNLQGELLSIKNKTTSKGFLSRTEVKYIYKKSDGTNTILFECNLEDILRSTTLNNIEVVDYEIGYGTSKSFKVLTIILQLNSDIDISKYIEVFKQIQKEIEESNGH